MELSTPLAIARPSVRGCRFEELAADAGVDYDADEFRLEDLKMYAMEARAHAGNDDGGGGGGAASGAGWGGGVSAEEAAALEDEVALVRELTGGVGSQKLAQKERSIYQMVDNMSKRLAALNSTVIDRFAGCQADLNEASPTCSAAAAEHCPAAVVTAASAGAATAGGLQPLPLDDGGSSAAGGTALAAVSGAGHDQSPAAAAAAAAAALAGGRRTGGAVTNSTSSNGNHPKDGATFGSSPALPLSASVSRGGGGASGAGGSTGGAAARQLGAAAAAEEAYMADAARVTFRHAPMTDAGRKLDVLFAALEAGTHVVQDRYIDSSVAYQGAGRQLDGDEIRGVSEWATDNLVPDLTVLLDLDPVVAAERVAGEGKSYDRLEAEKNEFRARLRDGFLAIAKSDPQRFLVVNATLSKAEVTEIVLAEVDRRLECRRLLAVLGFSPSELSVVAGPVGGSHTSTSYSAVEATARENR